MLGVEAARRALLEEIGGVFKAYGIGVDNRHLSLISDTMTYAGDHRPLNRIGINHNASPLLKVPSSRRVGPRCGVEGVGVSGLGIRAEALAAALVVVVCWWWSSAAGLSRERELVWVGVGVPVPVHCSCSMCGGDECGGGRVQTEAQPALLMTLLSLLMMTMTMPILLRLLCFLWSLSVLFLVLEVLVTVVVVVVVGGLGAELGRIERCMCGSGSAAAAAVRSDVVCEVRGLSHTRIAHRRADVL